jgi:uncharacterized protein YndB with AHSA1/START domain
MVDIIHKVAIKAPLSNVFSALATVEGVGAWWTTETTGESKPGGTVRVRFSNNDGSERGKMEFDVLKLDPRKEVHWRFKSGPAEWLGTDVTFNLSQEGELTTVLFGHRNWREPVEFMAHCSMKWATFLLSLKELVETGKGRPAPNDLKIES